MKKHVKFDKEELKKTLQSGSSPEDLLTKEEDEPMYDLAAVGGKYRIGNLEIGVTLGNLMLLAEIDSPLLNAKQNDEVEYNDCVEALYVLFKGKEVISDIMNIKKKISDMLRLKDLVKDNPIAMDSLLDRVEMISKTRDVFTENAKEFYTENFAGFQFQEVMSEFFVILADIGKAFQDLPQDPESKSFDYKKKILTTKQSTPSRSHLRKKRTKK
jgi:hypothetical protein